MPISDSGGDVMNTHFSVSLFFVIATLSTAPLRVFSSTQRRSGFSVRDADNVQGVDPAREVFTMTWFQSLFVYLPRV